ncbi:TPA: hypothetical protein MH649_13630 [Klebsiella pneumoniae]|nr:hypothetical protein [Klebsiella pneumoniae]HBX6229493.1 hypothetical protein [Klebsiella pneumoniae]HBY6582959.1 hypothetical protein [Klebsiella pneumoniae]
MSDHFIDALTAVSGAKPYAENDFLLPKHKKENSVAYCPVPLFSVFTVRLIYCRCGRLLLLVMRRFPPHLLVSPHRG